VDAIVRPLSSRPPHTFHPSLASVVFGQQEKFLKKFGDGGVGPPSLHPFQSYPPRLMPDCEDQGGAAKRRRGETDHYPSFRNPERMAKSSAKAHKP